MIAAVATCALVLGLCVAGAIALERRLDAQMRMPESWLTRRRVRPE